MNETMVIIEKETPITQSVTDWAEAHNVPILRHLSNGEPVNLKNYDLNYNYLNYDYIVEYSEEISMDYLEMTYCHAHDLPAVILTTDRLIIREIGLEDLDIYKEVIDEYPEAISDSSLSGLDPLSFKERHRAYIKYSYQFLGYGIWGVFLKEPSKSRMIGIVGIDGIDSLSVSYALFNEYQGQGYASEAVSGIIDYALKNLEIKELAISVFENNKPSLRLAEKIRNKYPEYIKVNILRL